MEPWYQEVLVIKNLKHVHLILQFDSKQLNCGIKRKIRNPQLYNLPFWY